MKCRKCKSLDTIIYYEDTKSGRQCLVFCNKCVKAKYVKAKHLTGDEKEFPGFGYFKQQRQTIRRSKLDIKRKTIVKAKINRNFYRSPEWKELRFKVLNYYGRQCMLCEKTYGEMHVDHIKPRSKNPELELDINNLQVLCKKCNLEKSNLHSIDFREFRLDRNWK